MAVSVTSLTRNGLRDWIIQRASAVILAIYAGVFIVFFLSHPHLDYLTWRNFFTCPWIRYLNALFLLSLVTHAWIGLWTVFTDYIKCSCLRLTLNVLLFCGLLGLVVWGVTIFWSV